MSNFKRNSAQELFAKEVAASGVKNACAEGGSRSGKSFEIFRQIVVRAAKADHSDHLICRETFNSAKRSLWLKTMPDVMRIAFPRLNYKPMRSDGIYYYHLDNGSNLYLAGLDDSSKLERLLGTEYSTLWFNESNQMSFSAVSKLKTRLAQKNNLIKRAYFDLNPTKTSSWVYQVFHQKVNPSDGEMLPNPYDYHYVKMNPQDNIENLDEDYLNVLKSLPENERKRFLLGEYDDSNNGAAVYAFDEESHVSEDAKRLPGTDWVGSDFNIDHNSDVICSQHAHGLFVWDEVQIPGDTFKKADELKKKGVTGASIICDGTGKSRRTNGRSDHLILKDAGFNVVYQNNPAVIDKINNLNRCFTLGLIKIHPRCKKLIRDLKQLAWDRHGQLDQKTDTSLSHLVDALAYLCWKLYPLTSTSDYKITSQRR